jgi:ABC-2 type transport system ATP-binding protein
VNDSSHTPVVEVYGLTRRFGAQRALDDVSLSIPRGVVFGLVGENGAGKTTLIKHLLGLYKAQTGTVRVFDRDPVRDPVGVLSRIGYLGEDRDLPDWMTVAELMRYQRAFYPGWDDALADNLRAGFRLDAHAKIRTLSQGQRVRTGLLAALAHRPELLLLDEPSTGLDPLVRREILAAIIRTIADEGRTVLFSSHLLDEIERVCDWLAMIDRGRVVLCGPLDEIKSAHRKLTVRFDEPQNQRPALDSAFVSSGFGRDWIVICPHRIEDLAVELAWLGGRIVDEHGASLDEIFIARVRRDASVGEPRRESGTGDGGRREVAPLEV